jgi:hypothetical protein
VVSNAAFYGAGAYQGTLNNCIVYYNDGLIGTNYYRSLVTYSCTTPMPTNGTGNITNTPALVNVASGNLHLQTNSPCINAGNNASAPRPADLDGNPRIVNGSVDMGAFEYQGPGSQISYTWLQRFGWPIDGRSDLADPDGDHFSNLQEWLAGTNPTNAASCLRMTWLTNASGVVVSCASSSARLYTLLRCVDLYGLAWTPIEGATDIPGTDGPLVLTDPAPPPTAFYRISVRLP